MQVILEIIWLLLPAGIANTAPVFAAKYHWLPALEAPIHARLLGSHKTWRGIIAGMIFGLVTGIIQYYAQGFPALQKIAMLPLHSLAFAALFGALMGLGALLADAAKSFVKRQLNVAPGKSFPIFDQVDFVIGGIVVILLFTSLSLTHIIAAFIVFGLLSSLTSFIGVQMKIKDNL